MDKAQNKLEYLFENAWLGLTDAELLNINYEKNPLLNRTVEDNSNQVLELVKIITNTDYIWWTAKNILNIELDMFQVTMLRQLWNYKFPMLIASRGASKTWTLAVYCILRGLVNQGVKVVVAGAAFRQSKYVFNYMETIWNESSVLRDLLDAETNEKQGPYYKGQDSWRMRVGASEIVCLPVGTGDKIRGERAQIVIAEEFACLHPDTLVNTDRGILPIKRTFVDGIKIQSGLNPTYFRAPKRFIKTPPTKAYRVTLTSGNSFICSSIHKVYLKGGTVKKAIDLTTKDRLIFPATIFKQESSVPDVLLNNNRNPYFIDNWGNLSESQLRKFILGIFKDNAAIIAKNKNRNKNQFAMHSFGGTELIKVCQKILLSFGFKTTISHQSPTISHIHVWSPLKLIQDMALEEILSSSCNTYGIFKILARMSDNYKEWSVTKVEELDYEIEMYDYEFDGDDHSFVGNWVCQHNSHNEDTFERVIGGFNVVKADPMKQRMMEAKKKKMKEHGIINPEEIEYGALQNQTIICGTADYQSGHFYKYWLRYKKIIESQGQPLKLRELMGEDYDVNFNWKDYCIIRLPYELLPTGFMDDKVIARAKATMEVGTYANEYGGVFSADSNGFFKHSLIESCTCKHPIKTPNGNIFFSPMIKGSQKRQYIYGIDPASEQDNLAVVILELHEDHRRVVYCWTTNASGYKEKLKKQQIQEFDYYDYCARKIRNLMAEFPCARIGIDAQGGGRALLGALHRPNNLRPGETQIWETIDEEEEKDSDDYPGLHIVELKQFANQEWLCDSNFGMKYDMENKLLIFPHVDALTLEFASKQDAHSIEGEGLEDCIFEVEELKNELITIQHTHTANGRDRWDLPSIRDQDGKKKVLHKDRYSALLIANSVARQMTAPVYATNPTLQWGAAAGRGVENVKKYEGGQLYIGPDWFTKPMQQNGEPGTAVKRR
jgi:hypothetical protein